MQNPQIRYGTRKQYVHALCRLSNRTVLELIDWPRPLQ